MKNYLIKVAAGALARSDSAWARVQIAVLTAYFRTSKFIASATARMFARFGKCYRVCLTYQVPGGKPDNRVYYTRNLAGLPEVGSLTEHGYLVACSIDYTQAP